MGGRGVLGSWVVDPGTLLPAGVAACNGAGAQQCTDRRDQRTEAAASAQQTRNFKFPNLLLPHLQEGGPPPAAVHTPAPTPAPTQFF